MVKMKQRKILSLFMMMLIVISSVGNWRPNITLAAEAGTDTTGSSVLESAVPTTDSVSGSAVDVVTGPAITIEDPITADMIGADVATIDQVYTKATNVIVTVIGQVSYIYGSNGTADTVILEDVINNEIIGLQIYDKAKITSYHIGDIVEVTGKIGVYGGVRQLATITNIVEKGTKTVIPAQELTIAQLLAGGDNYLSELVRIKNVTVGAYTATTPYNTPMQDSTGSINLYKGAAYPSDLVAGDSADVVAAFSKFNTTYQLRNGSSADYSKIVPPVVTVETPVFGPASDMVPLGQEITVATATSGAAIYITLNNGTPVLYDETNKPVINSFPYTISAYATKTGFTDSAVVAQTFTQAQVTATQANTSGAVKLGTKLLLTTLTEGAIIKYSIDNGTNWLNFDTATGISLNVLPVTVMTKATKEGYLDSEVSSLTFTKRLNEAYQIYFGQLHSHTDYSDGAGTCDQAFNYAKNTAKNIDFLAITDHSNSFDNAASASMLDGSMSTEWVTGHQLADQYTDSTFVGIYAYEMTWSNGLGHMNTYNTEGFQSRDQSGFTNYSTALANYYATLKLDMDSISQFNHPGTTFGDFNDFANYDTTIDQLISLIEVGNGEGAIGSSGYFASYDYYTRALDKGWHVAPTNNQDNHKGLWGDANTARTVVLADSLTRSNIYDALRNMRVYATEDNDLQIQYTLNGETMGTIMSTTPDTVGIKVDLRDSTDSAIGKVDVIVNGGVVAATKMVAGNEETVNFDLPADYSYYYIRVTQNDNDIAVTAPVWIKDVEAAGISKITTTEKLPIKGEAVKITTELFNNEASALSVQSMNFSVNDSIIHTVDINNASLSELTSGVTKTYSFDYTNNTVGSVNVKVTVHATLNGVDKIYSNILKLDYTDPALVTKIVVDGTHYNDYVTGYYGDNLGNFTEIAAEKDTKVMIVKDAMSEEILADCDLLIISAPAKKSGTANAGAYSVAHFEDDFINLVKSYTARGGDIIVCGLADYQDTANGQSTSEINKLLSAIKATTKINSDEAYDTVTNGGQAYRLYLSNYNTGSSIMDEVTADQLYSAYSGCTVLLDNDTVTAGKAEYLVKGHATTYSIDSKTYGGNYTAIDTGNAVLLAREVLDSGSNVFVSGTVFMSNFEIKVAMDNIWDKPYSNRTIMEDILDSVKKDLPARNISTVRSGVKGNVYCVEGTVTAGTRTGNAFFDTIYLQDATGGINIFPINQGVIEVGQKVKVIGYLDEYLGDLELRVISAVISDTNKVVVDPISMTSKEAMDYSQNGGKLAKLSGTVTKVILKNGLIETIMMKDSSQTEARVFIDGYIGYSVGVATKLEDYVAIGKTISVIGLISYDTDGARIRVRDRNEIQEMTTTPTVTPTVAPTVSPNTTLPTATPTITPVAKPTSIPVIQNSEVAQEEDGIKATISATKSEGSIEAKVIINADQLLADAKKEATSDKPMKISINISSEELKKQLLAEDVKKVSIVVTIPDEVVSSDKVDLNQIIVASDLLKTAREEKKDLSLSVCDESGKECYSWSFRGEELADSSNTIDNVNVAMSVEQISTISNLLTGDKIENGLVFNFHYEGILPAPAQVRVYVGNLIGDNTTSGLDSNDKVFLYYLNSKTGKLESLPHSSYYCVDKDGYITISLVHCSDYVILPKAADISMLTSLREQIKVTLENKTISVKGKTKTTQIKVYLPSTMEIVDSLKEDTKSDVLGAVTVTYESSNDKVAKVSSEGTITATGKGKSTITVKIVLYSGKIKTYQFKVNVK